MADSKEIYTKALKLLARREHSAFELKQKLKLKLKNCPSTAIDGVLERLQSEGYQCDLRYCESIIRAKASQGYGPGYIRVFLTQQNIDLPLIEQAFQDAEVDFQAVLETLKSKVQHKYQQEPLKLKQFLYRRGFGSQ